MTAAGSSPNTSTRRTNLRSNDLLQPMQGNARRPRTNPDFFEDDWIAATHHCIGHQLLEPAVFVFQGPQPGGLGHSHAAILRLPFVERWSRESRAYGKGLWFEPRLRRNIQRGASISLRTIKKLPRYIRNRLMNLLGPPPPRPAAAPIPARVRRRESREIYHDTPI